MDLVGAYGGVGQRDGDDNLAHRAGGQGVVCGVTRRTGRSARHRKLGGDTLQLQVEIIPIAREEDQIQRVRLRPVGAGISRFNSRQVERGIVVDPSPERSAAEQKQPRNGQRADDRRQRRLAKLGRRILLREDGSSQQGPVGAFAPTPRAASPDVPYLGA